MKIIIGILLWLLAAPALANTVTLQPSGTSCEYQGIQVGQLGNVIVTCKSGVVAPPTNPICSQPGQSPAHCNPPQPPVQPPAGCNAGSIQPAIAWGEVRQARQPSGAVFAYPVNATIEGRASLTFTQGQQPATAAGTITEYTVSTCPGVIDTSAGACYYRGTFVNQNGIDIYRRDVGVPNVCLATNTAAVYYINVRWTYPSCPFGGGCGFSLQWAIGPW